MCVTPVSAHHFQQEPRLAKKATGGGEGTRENTRPVDPVRGHPRTGFFCLPPKENSRHAERLPPKENSRHAKRLPPKENSRHAKRRILGTPVARLAVLPAPTFIERLPLCDQNGSSGTNLNKSGRAASCASFFARFGSNSTRRMTIRATSSGQLAW